MRPPRLPLVAVALLATVIAGPAPGFFPPAGPREAGKRGHSVAEFGPGSPLSLMATAHLMP